MPRLLRFALLVLLILTPCSAQINSGAVGAQRVLFLFCTTPDGQEATYGDNLSEQVDRAIRANSGGKAWVQGHSIYNIDLGAPASQLLQQPDGLKALQARALQAAERQVDPKNFDRFILMIPCQEIRLGSQGTVGKSLLSAQSGPFWASTAWIILPPGAPRADVLRAVLHELGHGFGFRHDNARQDGKVTPYGDHEDLMGMRPATRAMPDIGAGRPAGWKATSRS